jgi:hypothetical protein
MITLTPSDWRQSGLHVLHQYKMILAAMHLLTVLVYCTDPAMNDAA